MAINPADDPTLDEGLPADRIRGGEDAPGEAPVEAVQLAQAGPQSPFSVLPQRVRDGIVEDIRKSQRARDQDEERAAVLEEHRIARESKKARREWTDKFAKSIEDPDNNQAPTITEMMKDRRLEPADFNFVKGLNPADADFNTYGPGFQDAMKRVLLPPGDPNRISDDKQVEELLTSGKLKFGGYKQLIHELDNNPEEKTWKTQLFKEAEHRIKGPLLNMSDPKGNIAMDRWTQAALVEWKKMKDKGDLSPFEMYERLQKTIEKVAPTPAEQANSAITSPAGFKYDPAKITLDELKDAVRNRKIDRSTAEGIAVQRGWARAQPLSRGVPTSQ